MITKNNCPEGLRDVLPNEYRQIDRVTRTIENSLELCGYNPVNPSILEYYELFCEDKRYREIETLCKLIDRRGRILALRPDITIPVARLAATRLLPSDKPVKLFYSGNVYRYNKQNAKLSELMQIGGEIFGEESVFGDVESIVNACNAVSSAGLKNFRIDIGCTQITKAIVNKLSLAEWETSILLGLIEAKSIAEIKVFLEERNIEPELRKQIEGIPKLFGRARVVIKVIEEMFSGMEYISYIERLKNIINILEEMDYGEELYIDLAMPSLMGYYTGITFCGYSEGAGSPIFSGGRYDKLFDSFGMREAAVGFAVYINTLMEVLENTSVVEEERIIYYTEDSFTRCYKKAKKLRETGVKVVLLSQGEELEDVEVSTF